MAPERQDATHNPHPLHSTELIVAFPALNFAVLSMKEGAEYGQIETQTPQLLQTVGTTSAVFPLV